MREVQPGRRRAAVLLSALPLCGLLASVRSRAAPPAAAVAAAVADAADGFMADPRAVGLSIGVIHAGRRSSLHYGSVDKRRRRQPDDRTIYPIASLTKTFTATLLAQAQVDGRLRLDDDVRRYLDGDYPNLAFDGRPIQVRHLVSHLSGLPRMLPDRPEAVPDYPSDVPYPDRLRSLVASTTRAAFYAGLHGAVLRTAPGTRFQYSNGAAQLAGFILERVYGTDFDTLVRRRIAQPLGMRDTGIALTQEQRARLVTGHDEAGAPQAPFPDQTQAAGALKSSVADMLDYAAWQLAEQDPAVRLSHLPIYRDGADAIGLNWQLRERDDRRLLFQDGSHPGFACLLVLHPQSGIAIVLLSNEIDPDTLGRLRTAANGIAMRLDPSVLALP